MKKIHGPTYRYSGEILTEPEMILVTDHHYDEESQSDHVAQLLQASTCCHRVFFDHVVQQDVFDFEVHFFPNLMARESFEFEKQQIQPDWKQKKYAFNFMINKPRNHRMLLLDYIDQSKTGKYRHTLCWGQSTAPSIPVTDYRIGNETIMERGFLNGSYTNALTYQCLLQKNVFEPTAVSLITEPCYFERETIITEKTIMAIYGGTIPIWVGGWRIPDYMRKMGFDVFDDMVDHRYQNLNDPRERCRRAVVDNLHLLQEPIEIDHSRLHHNLDLVKTNPWMIQVNSLIETYPVLRSEIYWL